MSSLTLGWEYLTGYAVATDPGSRDRAEWPPHPARVFMALAAAWFETEPPAEEQDARQAWEAEGVALRWLETLGDPELQLPPQDAVFSRSNVTVYVPVNDTKAVDYERERVYQRIASLDTDSATPNEVLTLDKEIDKKAKSAVVVPTALRIALLAKIEDSSDLADHVRALRQKIKTVVFKTFAKEALGLMPEFRNRQDRTFPRVWVGHVPCYMSWPEAEGISLHGEALDRLCAKVTRIGHSSSLVRMWVAANGESAMDEAGERWIASDGLADEHCRVVVPGLLDSLPEQTLIPRILQFAELDTRVRASNGAARKKARAEFEARLGEKWKSSIKPPPLLRPKLGLWSGYRRDISAAPADVHHTLFDTDVLVLTHHAGPRLPLESTLAVTKALRGAVMVTSDPPPAWVSGHEPNGEPLRSNDDGHLALIPLPFVGHEHADGHLLGLGLVFPRSIDRRNRGWALGKLLIDQSGQPRPVALKLGHLGVWTLFKRDWSESRSTLAPETWTAFPRGANTWASVTPVALDRFPKSNRQQDRDAWTREVTDIVVAACLRIGLPKPVAVDIDTTSWQCGSSRAVSKRRVLRGLTGADAADAALGEGFPSFPCKGTRAPRPQVHVWLRFAEPVLGPILLGAGRYQGYGLCKPWQEVI